MKENKAGSKAKEKQKQSDEKVAKANAQVDIEINSAAVANMADVLILNDQVIEKIVDQAPQPPPEVSAVPEQA